MPFILTSLVIFYLSSLANFNNPLEDLILGDKILHVFAYYFYGLTIIVALAGNFYKLTYIRIILLTLVIGIIYALFDELHQVYVPGRFPDIYDVFADIIGILISLFFGKSIKLYIRKTLLIKLKLANKA